MSSLPGLTLPSLPGLTLPPTLTSTTPVPQAGDDSAAVAESLLPRTHTLTAEHELRLESSPTAHPLTLTLRNGTAEIFGTELAPSRTYTFRPRTNLAVYTWHGCTLEVAGPTDAEYIADETPLGQYANLHFALEDLRNVAAESSESALGGPGRSKAVGPRLLIVGPPNAGKTGLARLLTAYACKAGRTMTLVNLDPMQGMSAPPGSLSAVTTRSGVDVEEGWGSAAISGPSATPVKLPLVYHLGAREAGENPRWWRGLVSRLALAVTSRMEEDEAVRSAGCVVDMDGSVGAGMGKGGDLMGHVVSEFSITAIVVLGSERLYSELRRRYSAPPAPGEEKVTVIKLDKSGGCVDRDEAYMKDFRQRQIKEYFYGLGAVTLTPFTQLVDFDKITIYRINDGTNNAAPSGQSFDPGASDSDSDMYAPPPASTLPNPSTQHKPSGSSSSASSSPLLIPTPPSLMLQNALLAITHADAHASPEHIRDAGVLWYVWVADVDDSKRKLKVMNPVGARVPLENAVLWGAWPEDIVDLGGV